MQMPQQSTITCLSEAFIRRKNGLSDGSVKVYRRTFDYLIACFGDADIGGLTECDADDFVDYLQGRKYRSRSMTAESVNVYLRHAKAFSSWCAKRKKAPDVFKTVEFMQTAKPKRVLFEDAEIVRMIQAATDDRWRLIIALSAYCGLREGEVVNLTIGEVDFLSQTIEIRPKQDSPQTWAWQIKDKESRKVPLPGCLEGLMLRVLAALPERHPYIVIDPERYEKLLALKAQGKLGYDQRKLPMNNFRRTFRAICRRAGVPYRKFHTLRGSYCTMLAEKGLPVHEVAELAGHASVSTTLKFYQTSRQGYLDRARDAVGDPGLEPRTR
jgi:integrase